MRSSLLLAAACLFFLVTAPGQGTVNPSILKAPEPTAAELAQRRLGPAGIVERAQPSIVFVAVEVDGSRGKFVLERASSGAVVDPSGLIVTWRHLVVEAQGATDKRLFVQLNDAANTQLPATIVRLDDNSGLALLRVTPGEVALQAMDLGADPLPGEPVLVVARPEGKDLLAFRGVASPALAPVMLGGQKIGTDAAFLTDSRNDERCDGASVISEAGQLLGLYAAEHVQRNKSEPTLEDLKRPSFGVMLAASRIRRAFAAEFAAAANKTLVASPAVMAPALARAVQRVSPAVVSVSSDGARSLEVGPEDPGGVQRRPGIGSGVVLSARGLVVTNRHLLADGDIHVRAGGRVFAAELVKQHGATNLALLQMRLPAGATLTAAECGPDDGLTLGETVLAVGNPTGTQVVVTAGVVSAMREREGGRIQGDPNLGNQNGGGAVIDATGRLCGIGDAGAVDPLDLAFAQRGDRVTTESNLSTFVGIRRVRRIFASEIEAGAAATESIRAPQAVSAAERERRASDLTRMLQRTSSAMLNIYVARNVAKVDEDDPFAAMKEPELVTLGLGSGVIIDRSGLAISNWHVVDEAVNPDGSMRTDHAVTARVFGGKSYKVRVLSISREDDLSLLQLELADGEQVQAVELGCSETLAIGEPVAAIGNPHGRANTITAGVVTTKGKGIRIKGRHAKMENLIETDAAINGGNSGGALLDMQGRLVGINSAGGGTFNNVGYAIAVDHVRRQLLGLLFAAYKLRSPDLGLRVIDDDGKVLVLDVDDRGPAARAGVRSGDRVLSFGGVAITWSPGFARQLLVTEVGVEVELQVERQGEPKTFRIAPLAAAVWAVVRQAGLLVRDFPYAEDADRVRHAAIALHRRFTGDPTGEPTQIPERVVMVERVFPGKQPEGTDLVAGDFLLAIELVKAGSEDPVLVRLNDVAALRDLWNDRLLGSYEAEGGQLWKCWVARGAEVRVVDVQANRLFW